MSVKQRIFISSVQKEFAAERAAQPHASIPQNPPFGPSRAPRQASDRDTLPHLFPRNAVILIANGVDATLGYIAVYSAA